MNFECKFLNMGRPSVNSMVEMLGASGTTLDSPYTTYNPTFDSAHYCSLPSEHIIYQILNLHNHPSSILRTYYSLVVKRLKWFGHALVYWVGWVIFAWVVKVSQSQNDFLVSSIFQKKHKNLMNFCSRILNGVESHRYRHFIMLNSP